MGAVQIVVIFTDLVGSTELSSRLDPDEGEALRLAHFSVLRQAVAAHEGNEVKNLGDGLMVAFPSASAALACAVAMQQGIDVHNRSATNPLGLRIGISAGEAVFEEGDYFGEPVVEAARLCGRAEGGQILASDLVRANAGRRATQTFVPLGALPLKGVPDPVATVEVAWEPLVADVGVPLPARLEARADSGFFGRRSELVKLADALKAATVGDGKRVVLVSGEPGMGKTTLCVELGLAAHGQGGIVLYGRCDEELGIPYQPFAEALGHYLTHASEEVLAAHVSEHGGELASLAPALERRLGQLPPARSADAEMQRFLLFSAVVGLLATASAARPMVLVLDDLHWADKPTMLLLRYLVGATIPMRLLVVGTYRHSELSKAHPLTETLAVLRREASVERLQLVGFDDVDVMALMESAAGYELSGGFVDLAHALRRETNGNPFFVIQLLRHLAEGGSLYRDDTGQWRARELEDLGLPESVREVVDHRVARLGQRAEELLSTAAVVGRDFDLEVLGALSGMPEAEMVDVLDRGVTAALLTDVGAGRYSFAHAVIQHALYDGQTPTRRQLAHRRVAETLEALYGFGPGPRAGELARHWLAATRPTDATKALSYARWAGEAALAGLAPEEAVRWFSQALEVLAQQPTADERLRVELLIGLGSAQRLAGDPAHRETLLEAGRLAEHLGDTERLVQAALANNRGFMSQIGAVDEDRVAVLEAALAATDDDRPERARLLAVLAVELTHAGDWPRRRRLIDQAVAMARRLGDSATLVRVLNVCFFAMLHPATLEERLSNTAEVVALTEGHPDPAVRHFAHRFRLYSCVEAGDLAGVDANLPKLVEAATDAGDPGLRWAATFIRSFRSMLAGRLEEAESLAEQARQIGTDIGFPEATPTFVFQLFEIRRQQDRLAELESISTQAAAEHPDFPLLQAALAELCCDVGDNRRARNLLADGAPKFCADYDYDPLVWTSGATAYAGVCVHVADLHLAGRLYERLVPWQDHVTTIPGVATRGAVSLYLGMLATVLNRYEAAEAHLAQAMAIHRRLCAPFWIGRTQLERARLLLARDDREQAIDLLDEVAAAAARFGFASLERHAALLRP